MRTVIDKIGMEIEGEFNENLERYLMFNHGEVGTDGSLDKCTGITTAMGHSDLNCREFRSTPQVSLKKYEELFEVLQKAWNKKSDFALHSNKSCGLHLHYSFKSNDSKMPVEIWSKQFHDLFFERLFAKFRFDGKLQERKKNQYCIDWQNRSNQDIAISTSHYKALNYGNSYNDSGRNTIEFRIFPSHEPKKMWQYLEFTTKFIQWFLEEGGDKLLKESQTVEFETLNAEYKEVIHVMTRSDSHKSIAKKAVDGTHYPHWDPTAKYQWLDPSHFVTAEQMAQPIDNRMYFTPGSVVQWDNLNYRVAVDPGASSQSTTIRETSMRPPRSLEELETRRRLLLDQEERQYRATHQARQERNAIRYANSFTGTGSVSLNDLETTARTSQASANTLTQETMRQAFESLSNDRPPSRIRDVQVDPIDLNEVPF